MTINDLSYEERLDFAARDFYVKQGMNPDESVYYNNGTLAYTTRPRWVNKKEELQDLARHMGIVLQFGLIQ